MRFISPGDTSVLITVCHVSLRDKSQYLNWIGQRLRVYDILYLWLTFVRTGRNNKLHEVGRWKLVESHTLRKLFIAGVNCFRLRSSQMAFVVTDSYYLSIATTIKKR